MAYALGLADNTIGTRCNDCLDGHMRAGVLTDSSVASLRLTMPCIRYVLVQMHTPTSMRTLSALSARTYPYMRFPSAFIEETCAK